MSDQPGQVFFHVDLDAFYASVEQHDHPEFRGKPVIVGALPGKRGVVSACSYEAREFGVHSAMPGFEAHRRCPHGIFVPVRMQRYQEVSREVMTILGTFTPALQQISVDEAFLDMTGTERLFGAPRDTAGLLKARVREQTGLTITVGMAASRFIAKLASAHDKPDGLCVVDPGTEADFVISLPVRDLWGVGKRTIVRLDALGINTVEALRNSELSFLRGHFGEATGEYLSQVSRGIDPGIYSEASRSHSISSETTFEHDVQDPSVIDRTLLELSEHVMFRLRMQQTCGATVTVKVRDSAFSTRSAQRSLKHPIGSVDELYQEARLLLRKRWDETNTLRLIGLGVSGIEKKAPVCQGSLFDDQTAEKRRAVEEAVIGHLKRRPGSPAITRARLLADDEAE